MCAAVSRDRHGLGDHMNYENVRDALLPLEKNLLDSLKQAQKFQKQIAKDTDSGDLKDLLKSLNLLEEAIASQKEVLESLRTEAEGFDSAEYFAGGDFTAQLLDACRELNVDVHGDAPVFEMFPYRVRIDAENQELYLDRKKVQCMRPVYFAQTVQTGIAKLNSVRFNADAFAQELADAYDIAVLKAKKKPDAEMLLSTVYKCMVPMARSRKEYDQQSFAFDIARLYNSNSNEIKDGRRWEIGPGRDQKKAIRILDQYGKEHYLGTVAFK